MTQECVHCTKYLKSTGLPGSSKSVTEEFVFIDDERSRITSSYTLINIQISGSNCRCNLWALHQFMRICWYHAPLLVRVGINHGCNQNVFLHLEREAACFPKEEIWKHFWCYNEVCEYKDAIKFLRSNICKITLNLETEKVPPDTLGECRTESGIRMVSGIKSKIIMKDAKLKANGAYCF